MRTPESTMSLSMTTSELKRCQLWGEVWDKGQAGDAME